MKSNNRQFRKHTKKNKNNRKYNKGQREFVNVVPVPIGVPDKLRTNLRYCDVISLTGTTAQYTYRANSLFDPDFTTTGHQPLYYDQQIASYEKYRVYAVRIILHVVNASQSTPAECVMIPASQIPTITSISLAKEMPRAVASGILPAFQSLPVRMTQRMSTKTVLGLSARQIYDQDYGAIFSANPIELWYYSIYGWTATSGALNLQIDVKIEFDCEFYDRAPVALSLEQQIERLTLVHNSIKSKKPMTISRTNSSTKQQINGVASLGGPPDTA